MPRRSRHQRRREAKLAALLAITTCHVVDRLTLSARMTRSGPSVKGAGAMNERWGVGVAILSSSCGGAAAVATRYLIGSADPFTLGAIRFGGGVVCLLPLALMVRVGWPPREDWPAVALLGFLF